MALKELCRHYGMVPSRNNAGIAHENGAIGQRLQLGTFDIDALGIAGVAAADDLVEEAAVAGQVVEIT